ncbi:21611_t:CDS:2 [Dentiscutata erythropus]|uniref:21611_t:CDS:1 n=1 Tax=Dentiscutata erythropus TaxID=1348616 RepID=A0A9N8ZIN2_9GLOM|nr:21611_t:CDS:2 [Dentiscutata erythropus]
MSSSIHVEIPIEDKTEILEIACSPNLEHVVALDENRNISLWSIISKNLTKINTIHIDKFYSYNEGGGRMLAVSDNKYASICLYREDPYNFEIFDLETGKEVLLTFPDWQKEINYLSFINNGNLIMVNTMYYRAYVFTCKGKKDKVSWVCKSMIELKYFKKIYITPKGKLNLFNDTIYEIMMCDIEKLLIKTHILLDWNYTPKHIEISDDEELLLVSARNEEANESRLYTFFTETGINLAFNKFHLIASSKGERLLFINFSSRQYYLKDPYNLGDNFMTDAYDPFENKPIQTSDIIPTQKPYIIKSDKIIYTVDGKVIIEELLPDDWIKYLRLNLKDTKNITILATKTIDTINEILTNDYNDVGKVIEGRFLRWGIELKEKSVRLSVIDFDFRRKEWNPDNKKIYLDILPTIYNDGKNFILNCGILENDDFVTITRIGVIIWTFKYSEINKSSEIMMHYYWNYWNDRLKYFEFEKTMFKNLFENWTSKRFLPASSYESFLKANITEEFYLTCYGKYLMDMFIKLKDDKWITRLELSENHPAFIASALSSIGFVAASTIINPSSTSLHLSSYGKHYDLSKTSSLNILVSNLWVRWISFQISFQYRLQYFQEIYTLFQNLILYPFQALIVKPGHEDSSLTESHTTTTNMFMMMDSAISAVYLMLTGYRNPYISGALSEVLRLPEEQPSLRQIEGKVERIIEDLPTQVEKIIERKFKDLTILNDLKDLKESIEELKTNK